MQPNPIRNTMQSTAQNRIAFRQRPRNRRRNSSPKVAAVREDGPIRRNPPNQAPNQAPNQEATPRVTELNHRLIIGVDYGTTFSGVSYVESFGNGIGDINLISSWPGPGREGDTALKTPSRIAYGDENNKSKNMFGYQATPKMKSYSWTKLLLDGRTPSTEFDDPMLAKTVGKGMLRLPKDKTATEVAGDYLRELYNFTVEYLEKTISPEVASITPFEFWFTVPAIWSDRAKDATVTAARLAGFGSRPRDTINLISEPEAAAVASLKHLTVSGSSIQIKPGDGVLVCDCGGGTVDLTTYKIVSAVPKLVFEELVEGAGGKCGSTYIDRLFYQWMCHTFGAAFKNLEFGKRGPGSPFMKLFESAKRDFSGEVGEEYELELVMKNVNHTRHYNDDESNVTFTGKEMLQFFDPVVEKIIEMLNRQMQCANEEGGGCHINRIILVGGFGDSRYLEKRVRDWSEARGNIRVLCPGEPQAAIVKGAALRGLEDISPIRRRSRRHYGFACSSSFRPGIDPESKKRRSEWDQHWRCEERVRWYIAKGQYIDENTKIVKTCNRFYKEGDSLSRTVNVYSFASENPPDYITDPGVEVVGEVTHVLTRSQLEAFDTKVNEDGVKVYSAHYHREVWLGRREGTLKFIVTRDGKELGSSTIQFGHD